MSADKGNKTRDPEQVRRYQQVYVQDMTVEHFEVEQELPQFDRLFCRGDAERIFCCLDRSERMTACTDAADPACYVLGLKDRPAPEHPFKKPGRLDNVQTAGIKFAFFYIDDNVSVPFNPCQVFNIYIDVLFFHFTQHPCICYTCSFY